MRRLPSIPIFVGFGVGLSPLLDRKCRRTLEVQLTGEVQAVLDHFGVPGRANVTLSDNRSSRDLSVTVGAHPRDFGWEVVRRSCLGLKDGAEPLRGGFPHRWSGDDGEAAARMIGSVVPAVIAESPACLLGDRQVACYLGDLPGLSPDHVESVGRTLRFLLDLGVAIGGDRSAYLKDTLNEEPASADDRRDLAERLFAQFRDTVTIFVSADLEAALVGDDATAPIAADDKRLPDEARERINVLEEWLYFRMGIQLPGVYWHRQDELPPGTVAIEVNDRVHPPLPTSKESFLADTYSELSRLGYRLLGIEDVESQLAHLQASSPDLVRAALSTVSIGDLTRVLRMLQRELIPTRDLKGVLERLLRFETIPVPNGDAMLVDPRLPVLERVTRPLWVDYVEFVRHGLRYRLAHDHIKGRLLLGLDPEAEKVLEAALRGDAKRDPGEGGVTTLKDNIWSFLQADPAGRPATLLCRPTIRSWVEGLLAEELPETVVIARSEIAPTIRAEPEAMVDLIQAPPGADGPQL